MPAPIPSPTLREALEATYLRRWAGLRSEADRMREGCSVVALLGPDRRVSALRQHDVARLRSELEREGLAPGSVRKRLAALSCVLATARLQGADVPALDVSLPGPREGRVRVLEEGEEPALLAALRDSGARGPEVADMAEFLLATGCRWGEAGKMLGRDVVERDGRVWVTFADTKNGKRRTLPVPGRCAARVLSAARAVGPAGKVFPVPYPTFVAMWRRVTKALEFDDLLPHSLRHTCITRLLRKGVDPVRVRDWAGHSSLATTMRYTHLTGKDLESVADAVD